MRRFLPLLILPFVVSACNPGEQPAAEAPAAEAPPAAATTEPAPASPAISVEVDAGPITGNWAAVPENCASPIVISATSFQGAENTCEITQLTDNGDGSLTASMTCQSEGQTNTENIKMTPLFGPTGEGIRLEYVDRGGDPVTVFRCGR